MSVAPERHARVWIARDGTFVASGIYQTAPETDFLHAKHPLHPLYQQWLKPQPPREYPKSLHPLSSRQLILGICASEPGVTTPRVNAAASPQPYYPLAALRYRTTGSTCRPSVCCKKTLAPAPAPQAPLPPEQASSPP